MGVFFSEVIIICIYIGKMRERERAIYDPRNEKKRGTAHPHHRKQSSDERANEEKKSQLPPA